ncbi:MAG TPA: lytic transglycosylase domain-containing protein [Acidimicrobiales bacterium]|nr:lytic transglycosylase domain-containing protein [Acidimicrobiales bacterium]
MTSPAPPAPFWAPTQPPADPPRPALGPGAPGAAPGFGPRFVAELATRPGRVVLAVVATLAAAALLAGGDRAGAPTGTGGTGSAVQAVAGAGVGGRGGANDAEREQWRAHAETAAATCPGLPADVLVAIGEVETLLGRYLGPSSAGARGPMQFLPATWSAYGTDGDGDGTADVMNPRDALHSAARLLCANGGAEPGRLRSALWNYNHSTDYVERVVRTAGLTL